MKQERIKYKDVMDLGFNESIESDSVYYNEYGFDYTIVTLKLTKRIYLDWAKETGLAEIIRVDKEGTIQNRRPVRNLEELKEIVDFFLEQYDKDEYIRDFVGVA